MTNKPITLYPLDSDLRWQHTTTLRLNGGTLNGLLEGDFMSLVSTLITTHQLVSKSDVTCSVTNKLQYIWNRNVLYAVYFRCKTEPFLQQDSLMWIFLYYLFTAIESSNIDYEFINLSVKWLEYVNILEIIPVLLWRIISWHSISLLLLDLLTEGSLVCLYMITDLLLSQLPFRLVPLWKMEDHDSSD